MTFNAGASSVESRQVDSAAGRAFLLGLQERSKRSRKQEEWMTWKRDLQR